VTPIGYTMMGEQAGPKQLVRDVVLAEQAGFDQFEAAGFTHLALVQVGADTQESFITWAATELRPARRAP
jgi:hypothetical protein